MTDPFTTDQERVQLLAHGKDRAAGLAIDPLPVKLSDLASIVGPNKLPVRRDRYFQAVRPLSEYLRLAQENGSFID